MLAYERKTGITAPKTLARYVVHQMETIPPSRGGEQCARLGNRLVLTDSAIRTLVTHFERRAPVFRAKSSLIESRGIPETVPG